MALPEELRDVAKLINNMNDRQPGWNNFTKNLYPKWWSQMLTSLVLTVGSGGVDEVELVTSDIESGQFRLIMVTSKLLVVGNVKSPNDDAAEHTVTVYRRSEVSSVQFSADGRTLGGDAFGYWPGDVRLVIRHPEAGSLKLPLHNGMIDSSTAEALVKIHAEVLDILRQ